MINAILEKAERERNRLHLKEALRLYQEALQLSPDNAVAVEGAAYCLYNLGQEDEATSMSLRALEINPQLSTPHVVLAYVYDKQKVLARSLAEIHKALELDPNSPEAHCCYGILLLANNELEQGAAELRAALQINRDMYLAHYNLAVYYQTKGERKAFLQQVVQVFRLKPNAANFVRLLSAYATSDRLVWTLILLIPGLGVYLLRLKVLLLLHALLIALYVSGGLLMIREKQNSLAYRDFGLAALIAFIDVLLLTAF